MANVVALNGVAIASLGDPDKDVIEHLEDLLARAQAGEVIAIMTVTCNADGSTGQSSAGNTLSTLSMIGQLERLKHRAIQSMG